MQENTATIINIEPATKEDAPAIHRLVEACKTLDHNSRYLYLLLCTHFNRYTLTAKTNDGTLAGFASSYPHPKLNNTLFIWQVGVSPDYRKHGIGSRLIHDLISIACESGMTYIEATVTPSNRASINMFKKMAKDLKTEMNKQLFFPKELLPENHEEEWLIRIGPIQKQEEL